MTLPNKPAPVGEIMEAVIAKGDLSKLTPEERIRYYTETCRSIGLNPLTKPFEYITLNGKLTLYARRDAADQLRKLNGISIEIVSQEMQDGLFTVHVRAKDSTGRTDEDLGVVAMPESLRGEDRANMILKAVTKGKRRVTLSLSGLGFLDETEVEDIPRNVGVGGAEEYVDVPPPGHPDRLPAGAPDIKPLPKKDARKDYEAMKTEMDGIQDPKRLQEWGKASADRIATFPLDWQDHMRGHYTAHLTALRAAYADAPSRTHTQLMESKWLSDLERHYKTCQDMSDFFEVDKDLFNPSINTVSQDARNEAHRIRQTRLDRLTVVQEPE